MQEQFKRAFSALKVRHYVIIVLAVLVIIYGVLVISNSVNTEARMMKLVSAAQPDNGDKLVLAKDTIFENKILDFLASDKLCAVTNEQAQILKTQYTFEEREFYVASQAKTVFVLYVDGPKDNLKQLEKLVGPIDNGNCQIVKGSKVVALLGPSTQ